MSSLREAIKREITVGRGAERTADAVLGVVEARLREHDRELLQAFLDNGVYAERWKVEERERARQRIEAGILAADGSDDYVAAFEDGLCWALEALGGSDE